MGFSSSDDHGPVANINVTPLVDVMLVLLVIFMVTAPMLQQGVDVNLPKASTGSMEGKDEQIVLSLNKEGQIFLGAGNQLELDTLAVKLKAIMEEKKSAGNKVYIKADTDLNYGQVMKVFGALYQGGIQNVGLVTQPGTIEDEKPSSK